MSIIPKTWYPKESGSRTGSHFRENELTSHLSKLIIDMSVYPAFHLNHLTVKGNIPSFTKIRKTGVAPKTHVPICVTILILAWIMFKHHLLEKQLGSL